MPNPLRKILVFCVFAATLIAGCAPSAGRIVAPTSPAATQPPVQSPAPTQTTQQPTDAPSTSTIPAPSQAEGQATATKTVPPTQSNPPSTSASGVQVRWTPVEAINAPPARFDHALALDSDKQQLILFGGRAGGQTFGDTWIYDIASNAWSEVSVPGPSARFGMGAVYDPSSKAVILFGGQQSELFNDVWAFDTENRSWHLVETGGIKPDVRYGHGTALDPTNNQLIVSHGFAKDGRHDDTWALDLGTNSWKNLTPSGSKPLKRCLLETDYSQISGAVYLFGGCSSGFGPCPQGDLWSFDVESLTWTQLALSGPTPSARENPSLVVDTRTGNLILFGGKAGEPVNDLWTYDPNTDAWSRLEVSGPSARKSHDAVYDASNNRVYLFGGSTDSGAVNDMWVLQL